ncbi:hypothetical protein TNCV_2663941 [Trichonephila clavipes]|nr:hypothetical protein TNCV_2663941 [Trichonephila clavipes]
MDDLLIPSQNEAEGLNKLRLVLQTAADFGLELNLKKFRTGLKLRPKYFGPYEVTKVNKHDRYEVQKIGQHEGPNFTCSPAPRTAWSSGCPCGYQLLADHFRSHDRTEVTRGSQPKWRDSPLPAAISTR